MLERNRSNEEMFYVSLDIKKVKVNFKAKFDENHLTIDIQMQTVGISH
ncbi:MAG: hypothetical protein K0Q73_3944 [Paenibacillus sp.]|jgi:hypothetical protein|nr:hypothetical protein [Paenibacillus sp.]